MVEPDYIVAIDLGTSHLVGMVGKKSTRGTITILAEEVEDSASCIRRGCVYNVEETARRINRLVLKLQNKLSGKIPGFRIEKVYIGVGGQSLRSIEHSEVKTINTDVVVSENDIRTLDEQCKTYQPDMLDVLGISTPVYYLDDKPARNPVGIPCKRIEARYKLIVGRPSIRKFITNSIERANINLAGIIVSPLALADAMFSDNEKDLGCTLIDFGAGVTSVVVFKNKSLAHLSVIPLGGNLITKDLTSLHLVESEAERIKITYGSALMDKNKEGAIQLGTSEGLGMREIEQNEINSIVEARAKEIVENIYARVESCGEMDSLGAGMVLTGGASALKNLPDLIYERFKQDVRFSTLRKDGIENGEELIGNPKYMTAISLLLKSEQNCASYIRPTEPTMEEEDLEAEIEIEEEVVEKKKSKKLKAPSIFGKMVKGLFDED